MVYSNNILALIIFSVLLIITIVILGVIIIYQGNKLSYINSLIQSFNEDLDQYCDTIDPIIYIYTVLPPITNGIYQKDLANALYEVGANVTKANCTNILPLPNPNGFNRQLPLIGIDPVNGEENMYAYIFWSTETNSAIFAFSGTFSLSEWVSDFQYELVPATELNGYKEGVMCHGGFYDVYLSIRSQLWNWWKNMNNKSMNNNISNINNNNITDLYITGPSLGGALSTICSFDFADVNTELIHYSFAAPRSGNVEYAKIFNDRVPQSMRINNTEDIIPALPPATINDNTFEQTTGNVPFTRSLGSLKDNHTTAYARYMPNCPDVALCSN